MPDKSMRRQRLDGKVSHEEYYRSVYKAAGVSYLGDPLIERRVKACLEDGDEHLNSIPLRYWDGLASAVPALPKAFRDHGDYFTMAGAVCAVKQAALDAVLDGEEVLGGDG